MPVHRTKASAHKGKKMPPGSATAQNKPRHRPTLGHSAKLAGPKWVSTVVSIPLATVGSVKGDSVSAKNSTQSKTRQLGEFQTSPKTPTEMVQLNKTVMESYCEAESQLSSKKTGAKTKSSQILPNKQNPYKHSIQESAHDRPAGPEKHVKKSHSPKDKSNTKSNPIQNLFAMYFDDNAPHNIPRRTNAMYEDPIGLNTRLMEKLNKAKQKPEELEAKNFTTDEHYEHYFSYFYNRPPRTEAPKNPMSTEKRTAQVIQRPIRDPLPKGRVVTPLGRNRSPLLRSKDVPTVYPETHQHPNVADFLETDQWLAYEAELMEPNTVRMESKSNENTPRFANTKKKNGPSLRQATKTTPQAKVKALKREDIRDIKVLRNPVAPFPYSKVSPMTGTGVKLQTYGSEKHSHKDHSGKESKQSSPTHHKVSGGSKYNRDIKRLERKADAIIASSYFPAHLRVKDPLLDDDDDFEDLDNVSELNTSTGVDSEDSEDGYRLHAYKMTHALGKVATTQSALSTQTSEESLVNPKTLLVPSLFQNVPPYLSFSSNRRRGPRVPPELYRILKWRVTNVMPKVVRNILFNSGMRLLKKTNEWMGTWGKHMKSPCFKTIRHHQKINHLPGSFKIGRKDSCWKNLQKLVTRHGRRDFGFMPKTFIIPQDLKMLRKAWPKYAQRNVKWILKPPASARGSGIRVINRWSQIPKRKPLIVQKYIERPLLINGSKFDLRLYVLVTNINPLKIYMYHNGLARFASVKYSDKVDTLNDRCMHLTNYSVNKLSSNYWKNEDVNACHGHKWTIKSLWTYLANRGIRTDFLWNSLRNLVIRTILAGEFSINNMIKSNMESKYSCYELFGFDILLDADLIPWLLEVNISPSLHSDLPLDAHVKAPLVQGVLNTALFNVPPRLSADTQKAIAIEMSLPSTNICYDKRMYTGYLSHVEKMKHMTFTRKTLLKREEYLETILDHLTPDDVRCLVLTEDELSRSAPLERIFPTDETYTYLKFTEKPRYYNRLLDAWETRYGKCREKGINLLQDYCAEKYHLQMAQMPTKKQPKCRVHQYQASTHRKGLALTTGTVSTIKFRYHQLRVNMPKYKALIKQSHRESVDLESEEEDENVIEEDDKKNHHHLLE